MKIGRAATAFLMALIFAVAFAQGAFAAGKTNSAYEADVLYRVNEVRFRKGLAPLSTISALNKAASVRADELTSTQSHKRPNGKSCFTVLDEYKIDYRDAAENMAFSYPTPAAVTTAFFSSKAHSNNMLDKNFSHVGIGYRNTSKRPEHYWVQLFVGGCSVKSVSIEAAGKYVAFGKGTSIQAIADSGLYKLVGKCDMHGEFSLPLSAAMCSGYNANKVGTQEITVKCYGKTMKLSIKLVNGVMGDANGNSKLDAGDATLILRRVVGVINDSGLNTQLSDVNGNGKIDSADAAMVLKAIV